MQARPYLMAWRLDGRKVVVVGGGSIGTAKVDTLIGSGARIIVVDPTPSARIIELGARGAVEIRRRRARPTDLVGATLLVAATGDSATNRRLKRWATLGGTIKGVVVNAVDDTSNCDVTVPAVVHRGPATVAISTGGSTPAGARFLREELTKAINEALPDSFEAVLEGAASARHELRETGRYHYDYPRWRQRFFEPAIDAARKGDHALIRATRDRFVETFAPARQSDSSADLSAIGGDLRPGRVTLVGAGPGGADLITVRGAKALAKADVVVYDRLVDPAVLELAPPAAERVPVGKAKGSGTTQEAINDVLISRAAAGSHVVRLKGGDPFVFGRGGEEVTSLGQAGIEVEVVPGISSSMAAPALAGIPVTDRRCAASFTVTTGHHADSSDPESTERWRALAATADTIVVLMAATTASAVARHLERGGRPDHEPVAFVHKAGSADQETVRTTLGAAAQTGCPFPSPTVMVIGDVVEVTSVARFEGGEAGVARVGPSLADR